MLNAILEKGNSKDPPTPEKGHGEADLSAEAREDGKAEGVDGELDVGSTADMEAEVAHEGEEEQVVEDDPAVD